MRSLIPAACVRTGCYTKFKRNFRIDSAPLFVTHSIFYENYFQ
jgi:hypothetical protein